LKAARAGEVGKAFAVAAISGISQSIEKLNGLSSVVAAEVEEQSPPAVKIVSEGASANSVSSNQTLCASKELSKLAENLSTLVRK
jgi:methyl-accepting chemotaxis protein